MRQDGDYMRSCMMPMYNIYGVSLSLLYASILITSDDHFHCNPSVLLAAPNTNPEPVTDLRLCGYYLFYTI